MNKTPPRFPEDIAEKFEDFKWDVKRWASPQKQNPKTMLQKELLLRKSLQLVAGKKGSSEGCRKIVDVALKSGLYDLAVEAFQEVDPHDKETICSCIELFFNNSKNWPQIKWDMVKKSVNLLVKMPRCEADVYWSGDCTDLRSTALAAIGGYLFFMGKPKEAFKVFDRVPEVLAVDIAIENMCENITCYAHENIDASIILADLIQDDQRKARVLTEITENLDQDDEDDEYQEDADEDEDEVEWEWEEDENDEDER